MLMRHVMATFSASSLCGGSALSSLFPHLTYPPADLHLFPLCVRFEARGGRGVDVSAGPAGPVPEDAGDRPGVRPRQEGGARPVSCSACITEHTSLSEMEELKSL